MRHRGGSLLLSGALAWLSAAGAQQPPPKGPMLPAINPALARPDQTATTKLDGPGLGVTWSEEVGLLLAACEGQSLHYWHKDVAMGIRVGDNTVHVLKGHAAPVTAVVAAGTTFASAGADGKVLVWRLPDDRILHTLNAGGVVRALAVAPGGKMLASAGDDGTLQLWDPATGKPGTKLTGPTDWQLALAFSPDGKTLAAGGYDGKLRVWDVAGGKRTLKVEALPPLPANTPKDAPLRSANVVSALAYSPDGKTIALGGSEAAIHLFQAADGKLMRSLPGHTSSVSALVFHPSGTLLVSASKDRTLRLWNPATGQMIKALEGHTAWVQGVAFMAQGTRLASVGADQTVRLWDLTDPNAKK